MKKEDFYSKQAFVVGLKRGKGILYGEQAAVINKPKTLTFVANLASMGYTLTNGAYQALLKVPDFPYEMFIEAVQEVRGGADYLPMYPNFPDQVMEASHAELFEAAWFHYVTNYEWLPELLVEDRPPLAEGVKLIELRALPANEFGKIFTNLAGSRDSISADAKDTLKWFINNHVWVPYIPDRYPFKENLAVIVGLLYENGVKVPMTLCKSAVDVLRAITYLSGGDVSLATNTKFKSLKRAERRQWIEILDEVTDQEDLHLHKEKFKRLFHMLHVDDYSPKLKQLIQPFRNNERFRSFASYTEEFLEGQMWGKLIPHLLQRPGLLARRISELIDKGCPVVEVLPAFEQVIGRISTRVLMQMVGWLMFRSIDRTSKIIQPKGETATVSFVAGEWKALPSTDLESIQRVIDTELRRRFGALAPLGKVFIDDKLSHIPIPMGMRSASGGMNELPRGAKVPKESDKTTIRLYTYWKHTADVDLSAAVVTSDFTLIEGINYGSPKFPYGVHSGDIRNGANGAYEFIDIDIVKLKNVRPKARYVVFDLRVFAGPKFSEIPNCHIGWMERDIPNSGEIFDISTVVQKNEMNSESKNIILCAFDLDTNEYIWIDTTTSTGSFSSIYSASSELVGLLRSMIELEKPKLWYLFQLHAEARGEIVFTKDEADISFGVTDSSVNINDVDIINGEYMV